MNTETHIGALGPFEGPPTLTMSSLEIAELTGKRHGDVLRDIRKMLESLHIPERNFASSYRGDDGKDHVLFKLPKRECIILVSGYDVSMRARIVDRWMTLEEGTARTGVPLLDDPKVLQALLLEHTGKRIEAEQRAVVAETLALEMLPKIEAHDRIAEAHGTFCRTIAAKMLGVPPHTLTRWMRTNGWTYRRPGDKDDIAYQSKINAGLLEHKIATGLKEDGTEWSNTQVRVTPKGLTVLAKAFPPSIRAA